MTRSDPEPPSYPEANEEALELSAGDGDAILDAILDAMIAETDDSTDSQVSDQIHPPILATDDTPVLPVDANLTAAIGTTQLEPHDPVDEKPAKRGLIRSLVSGIAWLIHGTFCLVSLIVILAVLAAIPILQLIAFGYLLNVSGQLAKGSKVKDSLPHLQHAGQIGLAAIAIFLAALPTQALAHLESVANLINQGSEQATQMRILALATSILMTAYLLWAWNRGGRLANYLWPQPKRLLKKVGVGGLGERSQIDFGNSPSICKLRNISGWDCAALWGH